MNDLISRQWLMECVNEGWIKFDTEKDENRFIHLVRDMAPPAEPEWHDCDPTDKSTLPEPGSWAIWSDKEGHRIIARWKEDAIDHFFPDQRMFDFNLEDAVAWMEIPERTKNIGNEKDGDAMNEIQ